MPAADQSTASLSASSTRKRRRDIATTRALAGLGVHLSATKLPDVEVRLPKALADVAIAAWERDDEGALDSEDLEQRIQRHRAGTLALIGPSIVSGGTADRDEVVVRLQPALIGNALSAAADLPIQLRFTRVRRGCGRARKPDGKCYRSGALPPNDKACRCCVAGAPSAGGHAHVSWCSTEDIDGVAAVSLEGCPIPLTFQTMRLFDCSLSETSEWFSMPIYETANILLLGIPPVRSPSSLQSNRPGSSRTRLNS